jgi:tetratricopeptide (TPR) repeat protein
VLLAVIERASATGFDAHTSRLARSTGAYLRTRYAWTDIIQIGQLGLAAARRLGDEPVEAVLALDIARAYNQLSQLDRAAWFYRQALALATGIDDLDTAARAESGLATAGDDQTGGRPHAERALSLFQRLGDRAGELRVLNQLGWIDAQAGDFIRAGNMCNRALSLAERLGDHDGRAMTLDSLGFVHRGLGQHREAVDHYQRALAALTERADKFCEAEIEANLADTYAEAGQTEAARTHWQRALVLMESVEHRDKDRVRAALAAVG